MAFEAIIALFFHFGLVGLLVSSFLSALVFVPGYSSFLIPIFIKLRFNPWIILAVLSAGAIAGEFVNYYLGVVGSKYVYHKKIKDAEKWLNRWGEYAIFIVNLIPFFPADFLNVLVGFLKMDRNKFLLGMALGKILQYFFLIFSIRFVFSYLNFI
jgi:membrane protein YqaA with SNARE-associated domain